MVEQEIQKAAGIRIGLAVLLLVILITAGGFIYHFYLEPSWSIIESIYFAAITLTTIGYGDLVPTHDVSRIFTVAYALVGVGIVLYILSVMGSYYIRKFHRMEKAFVEDIRQFEKKKEKI